MIISEQVQRWIKEQIYHVQNEAFSDGSIASLKSLKVSLEWLTENHFTKNNILLIIKTLIEDITKHDRDNP